MVCSLCAGNSEESGLVVSEFEPTLQLLAVTETEYDLAMTLAGYIQLLLVVLLRHQRRKRERGVG